MDKKAFAENLRAKLTAVKTKTLESLATLRFGQRIGWLRLLTTDMVVPMKDFSETITALAGNPMLSAASPEEMEVIEGAVIQFASVLHHMALEAYLKATQNFAIADFFIDSALTLTPVFDEEIIFNDRRVLTIWQGFVATEVLAPDCKQQFAETMLEMFPYLPTGKEGSVGLRGVLEKVATESPAVSTVVGSVSTAPARIVNGSGQVNPRQNVSGNAPKPFVLQKPEGRPVPASKFVDLGEVRVNGQIFDRKPTGPISDANPAPVATSSLADAFKNMKTVGTQKKSPKSVNLSNPSMSAVMAATAEPMTNGVVH